ncbi:MAG: alpha/beta fold hydrolase [Ketobacteraceae bacterium]|nr:alpha/beta fold hydrolase [Ketobacteraceae bacterium]
MDIANHGLTQFINGIYELLERPAEWQAFSVCLIEAVVSLSKEERQDLIASLDAHFGNGFELSEKLQASETTLDIMTRFIRAFGFRVAVVAPDLSLLACNSQMQRHLQRLGFDTDQRALSSDKPECVKMLKELDQLISLHGHDRRDKMVNLGNNRARQAGSLIVCQMKPAPEFDQRLNLLLAPAEEQPEFDMEILPSSLSNSERNVLQLLMRGLQRSDIAAHRKVSPNTVRRQLNSVFRKLNVSSRTELAREIGLSKTLSSKTGREEMNALSGEGRTLVLELNDGRLMSYCRYGAPEPDQSIIFCHGYFGSRYQLSMPEAQLRALGIQVLIPDRPGVGFSTALSRRRMEDWPDDLVQLMDHHRIRQASLLGFSSGAGYAVSAAFRLQDRVRRLALVSPFIDINKVDFNILPDRLKVFLPLVTFGASATLFFLDKMLRLNLLDYMRQDLRSMPDFHLAISEIPALMSQTECSYREIKRHGARAWKTEIDCWAQPWPFELSELDVPASVWLGATMQDAPAVMTRSFFGKVPEVRFFEFRNRSSLLVYSEWKAIINWLIATSSADNPVRRSCLPMAQ